MQHAVKITRASKGHCINGIDYYLHYIWNNNTQTEKHCVLTKYIVPLYEYRKYLLFESHDPDECEKWINSQNKNIS